MGLKTIEMIREIRDAMRAETKGLDRRELVAYYSATARVSPGSSHRETASEVRERPQTES